MWCGSLFLLAGGLGICAAQKKINRCLIVAFMVLSILASVFAGILIIISSVNTVVVPNHMGYYCGNYDSVGETTDLTEMFRVRCNKYGRGIMVLCSLLAIVALAELIVSVWSSIVCCSAVCCGRSYNPVVVYTYQPQQLAVPQSCIGTQSMAMAPRILTPGTIVYQVPAGQPLPTGGAPYPQAQYFQAYGNSYPTTQPVHNMPAVSTQPVQHC